MNKIGLFFLILCVASVAGCATTYQYQGHNLPSLSTASFPSFSPVVEITDGIKTKIPEASGETKISIAIQLTQNQKEFFVINNINWKWDINVEDNLIYSDHTIEIVGHKPKTVKNIQVQGIHETSGKEIKMDVSNDSKKNGYTFGELNNLKKQMSGYINNQFASLGKSVKTGDVFKNWPNEFPNIKNISDSNTTKEISEIVKGIGVYKDKRVVVTEFIVEDSIYDPEYIMEYRGKGYSLYDAETFIQLFGEGVIYVSFFSPEEGNIYFKLNMGFEANDLQIRSIIEAPILAK